MREALMKATTYEPGNQVGKMSQCDKKTHGGLCHTEAHTATA